MNGRFPIGGTGSSSINIDNDSIMQNADGVTEVPTAKGIYRGTILIDISYVSGSTTSYRLVLCKSQSLVDGDVIIAQAISASGDTTEHQISEFHLDYVSVYTPVKQGSGSSYSGSSGSAYTFVELSDVTIIKAPFVYNFVYLDGKLYPSTQSSTTGSTDTSSKIFLVGATSQTANPQTYSDDQVYVTNGQLDANTFRVAEKVIMQYNSSTESLDFVFA